MTPQGLVKVMNRYFSTMSAPIRSHRGIIDKYIGDAIMAYWGPPFADDAEQARLACLAALDMLRLVPQLADRTARTARRAHAARRDCDIRIGIATGEVLVGSIGSEFMMSYTVMGDTVNLASRLEGANKVYGGRILVSEATIAGSRRRDRGARDRPGGGRSARPSRRRCSRSWAGKGELTAAQLELRARYRRGTRRLSGAALGRGAAGFRGGARGHAGRRTVDDVRQAHRQAGRGSAGRGLGWLVASRAEVTRE